ncbi:TPA: hypothetical protein RNT09_002346 [Stenotrophomonas maltophilia]|nr:hypothetical protein [Stenotrophomonas maltophilia]HDS3804180.1 hypothetical protein [Stenotrophomonas maltophilia]HDX0812297.1 hypothetical protein [Stenotrophomonas maltophilia]HDX0829099.1 hypothetical protein [Stenotrophomonas maltophilia]HDX0846506.1 hypothetical protein [Stenotrophomonas maltophilia]
MKLRPRYAWRACPSEIEMMTSMPQPLMVRSVDRCAIWS